MIADYICNGLCSTYATRTLNSAGDLPSNQLKSQRASNNSRGALKRFEVRSLIYGIEHMARVKATPPPQAAFTGFICGVLDLFLKMCSHTSVPPGPRAFS